MPRGTRYRMMLQDYLDYLKKLPKSNPSNVIRAPTYLSSSPLPTNGQPPADEVRPPIIADLAAIEATLDRVEDDLRNHDPFAARKKLLASNFTALVSRLRHALPPDQQAIAVHTGQTYRYEVDKINLRISAAWWRIQEITCPND